MNQWKIEVSEGPCKCVACEKEIADGERKVVVAYGARKNFCLECGKKHMAEKLSLLQTTIEEANYEKPVFDCYIPVGEVLHWRDMKGQLHPVVALSPEGVRLYKQGEGSPVKNVRGKPEVLYSSE